jgi:hypothetical protein
MRSVFLTFLFLKNTPSSGVPLSKYNDLFSHRFLFMFADYQGSPQKYNESDAETDLMGYRSLRAARPASSAPAPPLHPTHDDLSP